MIVQLQRYRSVLPGIALALLIVVGSPSTVEARPGNDSRQAETEQVAVTDVAVTTDDSQMSTTGAPVVETETGRRPVLRASGEARVKALRAEIKSETSPQKREKVCDGRKKGLETKFDSIFRNATRYQGKIDGVFAKLPEATAKTFPTEHAAAVAAQAKARISVKALDEIKVSTLIDCKNLNVATEVATFKAAAASARTDLKDYKMAVKDLVKVSKSVTTKPTEMTEEKN